MYVELIAYTQMADGGKTEDVCGTAASVCTQYPNKTRALKGSMASGHESVIEHASFTFKIEGVSRALLAQLTRHRIASFSVMSQRYVDHTDRFDYVVPERIKELGEEAEQRFNTEMQEIHKWYS